MMELVIIWMQTSEEKYLFNFGSVLYQQNEIRNLTSFFFIRAT